MSGKIHPPDNACYGLRGPISSPMNENARKAVHLAFGIAIAAVILVLPREQVVMLLAGSLLIGLVLSELVRNGRHVPVISFLVLHMEREGEFPGKGAICFVVSSLFCSVFFSPLPAAAGVLSLAVLDSVSALAGMRIGRKKVNKRKTLEGSLAGIAINSVALLLLLDPGRAILASLVAGTVEMIVPLDDNLVIPPAVCLALLLFGA